MICKRFEEKERLQCLLVRLLPKYSVDNELRWLHIKHRSEVVSCASSFTSVVYYVEKPNV